MESVVTHELVQALGFDHHDDPRSVMFGELSPGVARRLTVGSDLYPIGRAGGTGSGFGLLDVFAAPSANPFVAWNGGTRQDVAALGAKLESATRPQRLRTVDIVFAKGRAATDTASALHRDTARVFQQDESRDWERMADESFADQEFVADLLVAL